MSNRLAELAEALQLEGVTALFGVPGSGLSWQLITALAERAVPFYGVAHEAAGAIMAGAFGRQSGRLGCAISIKGPGMANMLPGILSNSYEQWPVLSIAEAYGPTSPRSCMHKRLDHRLIAAPVVKAYATMGDPARTTAQLVDAARAEIQGPVHLDVFAEDAPVFQHQRGGARMASRPDLSRLHLMVERAARPVVIAGGLASRSDWGSELNSLRVPVFTTVAAKGVVDEWTPWAAGVFTGDGKPRAPEAIILPKADLIVGLGLRNTEVLTPRKLPAPLVILDVAGAATSCGFCADEVFGSVSGEDFAQVLGCLQAKTWGAAEVHEGTAVVRDRLTGAAWLPGTVFMALETIVPRPNCLVADTGLFCTVAEHVWRASHSNGFLASANGRFMGTGIPMALGAAIAAPSKPTICAVGDGGISLYVAEVKLAIDERLPILFVLMTDGRYGSIAASPSAPGLLLSAITVRRPSWYRAIGALGCAAAQVRNLQELTDCLQRWGPTSGPLFVEAVFDPESYAAMTADVR